MEGWRTLGKAEIGSDCITLRDVHYIQSQVNPDTRAVSSILIKRGNECHKPNVMYINAREVLMIEPVAADSQVAKLIQDAKDAGMKK